MWKGSCVDEHYGNMLFRIGPSTTEQMKSDNDKPAFSTVRADVCAPQTERGVYYFEINIIKTGLDE